MNEAGSRMAKTSPGDETAFSRTQRYLILVLLLLTTANYMERSAFGLVVQDIKIEMALSDTQLGLLTGIAFAFFYTIMGVPIARLADRGNRVTIISVTVALCGAAVSLCGAAGNFVQLMLIRVLVGVGEAGSVPPQDSLMADVFRRGERARASSLVKLGSPLSVVLGFFIAGWLNQFYGWRVTLALIGIPGVLVGILAFLTIKDPRASQPKPLPAETGSPASTPSFVTVLLTLWRIRTFRMIIFADMVAYFFVQGIAQWKAPFFIRSFGMQTGELGTWFALIYGGGGLLGVWLGGYLANRYARHNERRQLRAMAIVSVLAGLLMAAAYSSPNPYMAMGLLGLTAICFFGLHGPLFAIIQTIVPPAMIATAVAFVFMGGNLIGMGLGPLLVGAMSDAFASWAGKESLRYALILMCPGYMWCALFYAAAARAVRSDIGADEEGAGAGH